VKKKSTWPSEVLPNIRFPSTVCSASLQLCSGRHSALYKGRDSCLTPSAEQVAGQLAVKE